MFKQKPILLAIASSILLIVGWPPIPTAILLFFAYAPLFLLHHHLRMKKKRHLKFWAWTYLSMFLFNIGVSWWVWNASPSGCLIMLFANSLILSLPFLFYSLTETILPKLAFAAFISFYIGIEYFHFNWNAAWPWMTLGKGLASIPFYIQWYEFTGELGGTLLVLIVNIMVFKVILSSKAKLLWKPISLIIVMGVLSYICTLRYSESDHKDKAIECIVTQPNIDPYEEKFQGGKNYVNPDLQIEFAIDPARPLITKQTKIILLPETAIVGFNDEADLNNLNLLEPLRKLTDSNDICIISGAETYCTYNVKLKPTQSARFDDYSKLWFDNFNTAINIKRGLVRELYHKSKLVAGVERMPYEFLETLSINLGGTSGSLGTSDKAINFTLNNGCKVAPLICYESIFGDYTNEFIRDGANLLTVVTNDGWWGNSPGFTQHLQYGAIRCIETRREMIRSANTGISAKIDRFGNISHQTKYKEKTAFVCEAIPYSGFTFYVQYGNLIGKAANIFSILFLSLAILLKVIKKKENAPA